MAASRTPSRRPAQVGVIAAVEVLRSPRGGSHLTPDAREPTLTLTVTRGRLSQVWYENCQYIRIVQRTRRLAWLGVIVLVTATSAWAEHGWAPVLTIDPASAKSLMDRGERVEPLDLRPPAEFQAGRLPRARSLPLGDLPDRVDEIPRNGVVVLYCGCPRDRLVRAYQFLRGRRYTNVFVLEGDIDAWRGHGYALER